MAGIKISALPAVASALTTDFFPVVQGGVTSQETLAQVQTLFGFTGGLLALNKGGTNAALVADLGGIVYSTATALAILAHTATANQVLLSGAAAAPTWSTATYPATTTINQLLFSSAANVISGIATVNSATLITSAGGIPSISQTLPTAVQGNITQLGAQSQALNMNTHLINNVTDPVSLQDAATKNYVDNLATGGGAPVVAASTGALTVTQAGAGVGATLTNAGAQAVFSLDGQSPTVGQRVLIKNQAVNTQNGVYTVTNVGSGATNWVLTRALDYDTPADINNTGVIPVSAGTVNANTGWINTTTMVTVDTTPITFVQFGASYPLSLANGGTSAALTASNGGIFYSTGSAGAILAGTATAGLALLSGASTTPSWSTSPPITQVNVQAITTTGAFTYTKTTGTKYAIFELQAGGGGSGGAGGAGGQGAVGSGGNGGGYMKVLVNSTNLAGAITGSVGVGGAAGASGNNAGGNGGNTTLVVNGGSTWTAGGGPGGAGGAAGAGASTSTQQGGGTVTSGTNATLLVGVAGGWNSIGQIGAAAAGPAIGSGGGASILGLPVTTLNTASAGNNYGGGAGGGANISGANIAGAVGGQGIVIVTEFISV